MTMIQCISPIDGSVYAERPAMSPDAAAEAVGRARAAQKAWAKRPLEERVQARAERRGPPQRDGR